MDTVSQAVSQANGGYPVEPFRERVQREAAERGISPAIVAARAFAHAEDTGDDRRGTSTASFEKAMSATDDRGPNVPLMEHVAHVLGIHPAQFPEYRLAIARRQLDEREVGLEQALEHLADLESL